MKNGKGSNDNKLIVVSNKVAKTVDKTGKLVVNNVKSLMKIRIGKFKGIYALGVVAVLLLIIIIGNMFGSKDIDYPVVYNNSDGDLYLINTKIKNSDDAIKLASYESVSNVTYANTSNRYVLFQKNEDLYLYDSKHKDETTLIESEVEFYDFTEDDKFVVIRDSSDSLKVYNFKETSKIESDVSDILGMTENKILYEKENIIYVRSINPKKEDRHKVTEEYDSYIRFSEDGKKVLFINKNKDLISYNVSKNKETKIASDVTNYYCDSKSCDKLFYVESKDTKSIFYYDGKNSSKITKDIYSVNATNVDDKQIVYSKIDDGEYSIYYQKVGNDPVEIEDNLTSIRTVRIFEGKEIYYINGKNEVKYVKINGAKLSGNKTLASDVTGYLYLYDDGYAYVADVDKSSNGTLYMAKNGKAKKIDDTVNSSIITVNTEGNKLYYLKDYKSSGDLYVTSGGKGKKIDEDIYNFEYINDDLIYYIKDYSPSKSRGDLYRYNGKSSKIADNVTRVASSPVYYQGN